MRRSEIKHRYIDKYVISRGYGSGVHVGVVDEYDPVTRHAFLKDSRRIWSWEGAFTLTEVSELGIKDGRLSMSKDELMISDVLELIPCSAVAEKILREMEVYKP
jgi:hypothetical protein